MLSNPRHVHVFIEKLSSQSEQSFLSKETMYGAKA